MLALCLIIILILLIIIYIQFHFNHERKKQIKTFQEKLNRILSNNSMEQLLMLTSDKSIIPILIEVNKLLYKNQRMIAEHYKMESSIKKMISNISHDLRTPLTVILGYIEMINLDPKMNDEERTLLLSKVQNKTNEVLELIRKFFDLAKLESGDKEIQISCINMNEVCRNNILSFYEMLTMKGFNVEIDIPEYNVFALGNIEVVDRILNNLISNAITYGGDGKIIGINLRYDDSKVYIDIWDRGKGIGELHIDRVFERMYTLEDSRNKSFQGSGLGLTITKRLVEKLGGEIHLTSKPFEKTVFTISLKRIIK